MNPNIKKYGIFLALFAAVALLIFLFVKRDETNVDIVIGLSVEATTTAVDFTNSKPISDKRTVNRILFALLSGKSLAGSVAPNTPPDAIMMIRFKEENLAYLFSVWVDQTSVVYVMGTDNETTEYRIIENLSDEEFRIFDSIKAARD